MCVLDAVRSLAGPPFTLNAVALAQAGIPEHMRARTHFFHLL